MNTYLDIHNCNNRNDHNDHDDQHNPDDSLQNTSTDNEDVSALARALFPEFTFTRASTNAGKITSRELDTYDIMLFASKDREVVESSVDGEEWECALAREFKKPVSTSAIPSLGLCITFQVARRMTAPPSRPATSSIKDELMRRHIIHEAAKLADQIHTLTNLRGSLMRRRQRLLRKAASLV